MDIVRRFFHIFISTTSIFVFRKCLYFMLLEHRLKKAVKGVKGTQGNGEMLEETDERRTKRSSAHLCTAVFGTLMLFSAEPVTG